MRKRIPDLLNYSVENAACGIFWIDEEGGIRYANKTASSMLGYSDDELINKSVVDIDIDMSPEILPEAWRRVKQEESATFEAKVLRKDGSTFPAVVAVSHIKYEGEEYNCAFIQDISDRKQADRELRQYSRELETINEIFSTVTTSLDLQSVLTRALDGGLQITGVEGGSICLINRSLGTLKLEAEKNLSQGMIDELTKNEIGIGDCLCGHVAETGEPLILWDNASGSDYVTRESIREGNIRFHASFPIRAEDRITGVLCIFTRTGRKPSERSLQLVESICRPLALAIENAKLHQQTTEYAASLNRSVHESKAVSDELRKFKFISDNSNDAHFLVDSEARFVYVNKTACEKLGYTEDELLNIGVPDVDKVFDIDKYHDLFERIMRERVPPFETVNIRKDGTMFPAEISSTGMKINGQPRMFATHRDITERKRYEGELLREKNYSDSIINSLPGIFYMFDAAGRLIRWNDNVEKITGYSQDEISDINVMDLLPEDERGPVSKKIEEVIQAGRASVESKLLTRNGVEIPFYYTGARLEVDDNKYIVGIGIDLSERKRMERRLRRSGLVLANAQRIAHIGDWEWDMIADTWMWSDETYHILGLDKEKYTPSLASISELLHPDDRQIMSGESVEGLISKKEFSRQLRVIDKSSDKIKYINIRGEIERIADGTPVRVTGTVQDITEEKSAEQALMETKAKYHTLFEESKDTIFIADKDGCLIEINPSGINMFGYKRKEDMLGRRLSELMRLKPHDEESLTKKLARDGHVRDYELVVKKRDGRDMIISGTASIVTDDEGNLVSYKGILRDISERKHLEQQLIQTQRLESVGRLAGGVAHDFNNILTAIQGYADLALMETPSHGPVYENLKAVRNSSDRAVELTRKLAMFGRQEPLELKQVNLNSVITSLLKMLTRLIGEQYTIRETLADDLWMIKADPSYMEQIIVNLVVNARDAMPEGGDININTGNVALDEDQARAAADAHQGKYVSLSVIDTGVGISQNEIPHIFEPFYTTKEIDKGSGLGLSVVYGLVEQHKGWIEVESTQHKGTNMTVFFPALVVEAEEEQKQEVVPAGNLQGRGERVLVIEDDDNTRLIAERILSEGGYEVVSTESVDETRQAFEQENGNFDLVFSDVVLPDGNGFTLVNELMKSKPGLRSLFATGYFERDKADTKLIEKRKFEIIQKPYSMPDLLAKIREILERKQ